MHARTASSRDAGISTTTAWSVVAAQAVVDAAVPALLLLVVVEVLVVVVMLLVGVRENEHRWRAGVATCDAARCRLSWCIMLCKVTRGARGN
jgi:hypothetical protein